MEKLEDYLYDFIGIFIPGFFLISSLWLSIVLFVEVKDMTWLIDNFSMYIIGQRDHFLIKLVSENSFISLLIVIIGCYFFGILMSTISNICIRCIEKGIFKVKKYNGDIKEEDYYNKRIVFDENIKILEHVKQYLSNQQLIEWDKVKPKNQWVSIYRWANLYSNKEEYSKLQVLLAKSTLIRSVSLACFFNAIFTVIIFLIDQIVNGFTIIMLVLALVYLILLISLLIFLISDFFKKQKILSNEATLILFKISMTQEKK